MALEMHLTPRCLRKDKKVLKLDKSIILNVADLKTSFKSDGKKVFAVNGVNLQLRRKKTLGIVGESGCGKSVTAHSILRLLPQSATIDDGRIEYTDKNGVVKDLLSYKSNGKEMRKIRGTEIGMIFQDPMASLNPVYSIKTQLLEKLKANKALSNKEAEKKVVDLLEQLNFAQAKTRMNDFPHQFSGGMKQRVMIAMALICNPQILIADEPTTALDVTIQAQILELLKELQQYYEMSIILITHNMGILTKMCDDVAVMYMGRIVEKGTLQQIFENPEHPYTQALLRCIPVLGERGKRLDTIKGTAPDLHELPDGCAFAPRCEYASKKCFELQPEETDLGDGHIIRCFNSAKRSI